MKTIFLDYASTTPMSPFVRKAMEPYFSDQFYNPSALYLAAKDVKKSIEVARVEAALEFGVRPAELVFTAGSTEANNLALRGVMELHKGGHCIVSAIEHDSVLHTAGHYDYSILPVDRQGIAETAKLKSLITQNTVIVSVMLANNEVGSIQPLHEISKIIAEERAKRLKNGNFLPIYLHCDASQAYNYLQVLPHSLGTDLVVVGGSKIYGPKQTAVLFVKNGIKLASIITGGGQEWGLRGGTENVPGIIGLVAALKETAQQRNSELTRLKELQKFFFEELYKNIPQVIINGNIKHRLPNNIHVTIPGTDNERLIMQLDDAGILAAAGSACNASSEIPSHVLIAMGLSESAVRGSLRFSMGRATTKAEITNTVRSLANFVKP